MGILHVHSDHSLFDGAQTVEEICQRAKEIGEYSVPLTAHGTLSGIDSFMAAGKKYGLNPIPGVEAYLEDQSHLLLVAKNYDGFMAISRAMKDANGNLKRMANNIERPLMTDAILEKHFKGNNNVIATSACVNGPLGKILMHNTNVRKEIQKQMDGAEKHKSGYRVHLQAKADIEIYKKRVRELNAEKKTMQSFSSPMVAKKLVTMSKKFAEVTVELACAYDEKLTVIQADKLLSKKAELEISIENTEEQYNTAIKWLPSCEEQIAHYKKLISECTETRDKNQSHYNAYLKAKERCAMQEALIVKFDEVYRHAKERLMWFRGIFPEFYIELQHHGLESERFVMPILVKLARETNTKIIAANDAHISVNTPNNVEARRILRFNNFKTAEESSPIDAQMYIKTRDELIRALSWMSEEVAIEAVNATSILDRCCVVFPEKEDHYPCTNDSSSIDELIQKAVGEKKNAGEWNEDYQTRLDHELSVIKSMGYVDYHLVVRDFCNAGRILGVVPKERRHEIPKNLEDARQWIEDEGFVDGVGVGPGRGSAVGSRVWYLLGISAIDPLKYDLYFERFLYPERVSMRDIDTDIATGLRGNVINYLRDKYGENAVCSIMTLTTFGAKNAIKYAGRDRGAQLFSNIDADDLKGSITSKKELFQFRNRKYQKDIVYKFSDAIPMTPGIKLTDAECLKAIKPLLDSNDEMKLLYEKALLIEGKISGTGVHAGGIIISDNDNVNDYTPLAWSDKANGWIAQCDMIQAEDKGLLKMDLLGLNTLDIITECVQLIGKFHGIHINPEKDIPFEPEAFRDIYASGFTNNVFQCESSGIREMMKEFAPTSFEDIVLLVAAYRPGPMQYLADIINVKHGRKPAQYKHRLLEPILNKTYGAIIYQEQVMQIFQMLAGYSLGGADLVRRAMSKKKLDKLEHERKAFVFGDDSRNIDGCVKRGVPEDLANIIFDEITEFASYAFNKSHAVAYARVSYNTAWLKHHYPVEFACAVLNNEKQENYVAVLSDCLQSGVTVLPPDINFSHFDFTLEQDAEANSKHVYAVRYGLKGIKGIGEANRDAVNAMIADRLNNGLYASLPDYIYRIDQAGNDTLLGKSLYEPLSKSGVFDFCKMNRDNIVTVFSKAHNPESENKVQYVIDSIVYKEVDNRANYLYEKDLLGSVISHHELSKYQEAKAYGCKNFSDMKEGERASVFGILMDFEHMTTKNGNDMIRATLRGKSGICDLLIFESAYSIDDTTLEQNLFKVVKVSGKAGRENSLIANRITPLDPRRFDCLSVKRITYQQGLMIADMIKKNQGFGDIEVWFLEMQNASGKYCTGKSVLLTKADCAACRKAGIEFLDYKRAY